VWAGVQPTPFRTGLFGITPGQAIRVSVLNAGNIGGTINPCFHPDQNALQRFVVSNDRGMHVRPFERYLELCSVVFSRPNGRFKKGNLPFPHSVCIMEAVRP
jgi:hypothetical protein